MNTLSLLFCTLPLPWALAIGRAVGWIWYHVLPIRRRTAQQNVDRVYGALLSDAAKRQIVRRSFRNLCMYAVECLRLPVLTRKICADLIDNSAMQAVRRLRERGNGVIAVTAHIDNWDLLGCSQSISGYPIHALLKDIGWRPGARFWRRVRTQTGLGQVAPRRSGMQIIKLLRRNQIVAFALDQHLPPHRAIACSFFGQYAATTHAPVHLALVTGAPILPVFLRREGLRGRHAIVCEPEFILETPHSDFDANVRHNTERLNRIVETWVKAWPEQWLWAHRRWKVHDRPEGWQLPVATPCQLGKSA